MPDLRASVIIPTWNGAPVLEPCLESLERQRVEGGLEVIVVDNASTDDTAQVLERHAHHVRAVVNEHNVGFSGGNNQAAALARGRVLVFLNSDTELLAPDTLERLIRVAEDPSVGVAGPMLLNPDGSLQPSCAAHPTVWRALLLATGLMHLVPDRALARVWPDFWAHDRAIDTGWVNGAALAVRAEVFAALGGMWPRLYGEEQDLAYRAQQRGLRVRFEPSARLVHIGDFSFGQRASRTRRASLVARSELVFLRTHYTPWRATAIRAIVGGGYAARALAHALLGHGAPAREFRAMARVYAAKAPPLPSR